MGQRAAEILCGLNPGCVSLVHGQEASLPFDLNHKYDLICQVFRFKNQVIRFNKLTFKHKPYYTNELVLLI